MAAVARAYLVLTVCTVSSLSAPELLRLGRLDEAAVLLRQELAADPGMQQGPRASVNLGVALRRAGRLDEAIAVLEAALEVHPSSFHVLANLGSVHFTRGDHVAATASLEAALAVNPSSAAARANIALARYQSGDLSGAARDAEHAIRLDPTDVKSHMNLAAIHKRWGNLSKATATWRRVLDLLPAPTPSGSSSSSSQQQKTLHLVHHNLGAALKEEGKVQSAIRHLRMALKFAPTNSVKGAASRTSTSGSTSGSTGGSTSGTETCITLGSALEEAGQHQAAATVYRGHLRRFPGERRVTYALANVLFSKLGLRDDARRVLGTVIHSAKEVVVTEEQEEGQEEQKMEEEITTAAAVAADGDNESNANDSDDLGGRARVILVTVATQEKPVLADLRRCAGTLGVELVVLGLGANWRGPGMKVELLVDFMTRGERGTGAGGGGRDAANNKKGKRMEKPPAPDDLICFVDAYDVALLPSFKLLRKRFRHPAFGGADVIFSGEASCWPDPAVQLLYPPDDDDGGGGDDDDDDVSGTGNGRGQNASSSSSSSSSSDNNNNNNNGPLRYLNSGSFVGRAGAVARMLLQLATDVDLADDQRVFTKYLLEQQQPPAGGNKVAKNKVATIDRSGLLFQTLFGFEESDFRFLPAPVPNLYPLRTGIEPCLLHGNGGSRYKKMLETFAGQMYDAGWCGSPTVVEAEVDPATGSTHRL